MQLKLSLENVIDLKISQNYIVYIYALNLISIIIHITSYNMYKFY